MKKSFTLEETIIGRGYYTESQVIELFPKNRKLMTINYILKLPIPITYKRWFVYNNCGLTLKEKQELALKLAWVVLPIYENKYLNDSRVKDCLQATEDFNNNLITKEELLLKRSAAYAYAAYAAAAAAMDVNADDAAAYAAAAAVAADAADATIKLSYSQRIQDCLLTFVKQN